MSQPPPLRRRQPPPKGRAARLASGDERCDDEKSTSAWMIAAFVAFAFMLILLALAAGVGAWMNMGSSLYGDQAATAIASGGDSKESGAGSATRTAPEPFKPENDAPSSKPSPDDGPQREGSVDASTNAKGPLVEKVPPSEAVPVAGKETPNIASGGSSQKERGSSVAGGSFFGLRAVGKRFVYVVDCSGSMAGAPYERAARELLASIANLEKSQQFIVILYSTESYPMFHPAVTHEFINATDDALKRTKTWLREFSHGGGGTNPEPALEQALAMQPDAVFFLTDGAIPLSTLITVRNANPNHTPVHAIGFVSRDREGILQRIAQENCGQYKFVP